MRRRQLALASVILVLSFGWVVMTPGAASAAPCRTCTGYRAGDAFLYGGTYHVRVRPPYGPGQGTTSTGSSDPADCSGIPLPDPPLHNMPPYKWPVTPMPCTMLTFEYIPAPGAAPCPDPTGLRYTEIVGAPTIGRWAPPGRFALCLNAQDFFAAGVAPPPGLLAISVWHQMDFRAPAIGVAPSQKGLVNLPSYFWVRPPRSGSGPFDQERSVAVGPYVVTVRGQANQFAWSWGDGDGMVSDSPGAPWPARSDVNHTYLQRGGYPVDVRITWHGQFRVDGGSWQDVLGNPDVSRTGTIAYAVRELAVRLTR